MKDKKQLITIIIAIFAMILLITDANTAAVGVTEGIDICLKVVIPSLFPFFIVTTYLNAVTFGHSLPGLKYICARLHIPVGCEFILPLGLTGGYPVGAKLIAEMYSKNKISKKTAQILLGYCNNAGPAFIFGIAGTAFSSTFVPLIIWIIHMASAIITGLLLPKPDCSKITINLSEKSSLSQSLKSSISACVSVCGWIITFKILLAYLNHWFAGFFLSQSGMILTGVLELSNGCLAAKHLVNSSVRFIVYTVLLSFGGICVYLQTASITEEIGIGLYTHGKIIQTCISLITAVLIGTMLFPKEKFPMLTALFVIFFSIFTIPLVIRHAKKVVEND